MKESSMYQNLTWTTSYPDLDEVEKMQCILIKKWWIWESVAANILFLNPDYAAARPLHSLQSNNLIIIKTKIWFKHLPQGLKDL